MAARTLSGVAGSSLIQGLHQAHFAGKIVLSTHHPRDVDVLRAKGADLVLCPFIDAAERAVVRILDSR